MNLNLVFLKSMNLNLNIKKKWMDLTLTTTTVPASRRVARIWKRGGAILKEWEVCKRPWLEFSLTLNQFQTVCQNLKRNVSKRSKIQEFFPPKIRWSPKKKKKKKKKRSSPKFRVIFRPKSKIQTFFSPEIKWSPTKKKKKKRSSPKFRVIFRPKSEIQTFFRPKSSDLQKKKKGLRQNSRRFFVQNFASLNVSGGAFFAWGGLFSIFHRKSASKAQKTCDFAYFTSQWGGSSPPRPPPWLRYCLPGVLLSMSCHFFFVSSATRVCARMRSLLLSDPDYSPNLALTIGVARGGPRGPGPPPIEIPPMI